MKTTDRDKLYLGGAGEYHVMAEFLVRGYNVAVPKIDIGDDILVIRDDQHMIRRVQVKTARADTSGFFQFSVSRAQLEEPDPVDLWYVFLARHHELWLAPVLIEQGNLREIQNRRARKHDGGPTITFALTFSENGQRAHLGSLDLSAYLSDWHAWPSLLSRAPRTQEP